MKFIKKQLIKESVEEVKEELTEAVDKNRSYDYDNVATTIANILAQHGYNVVDDLDTETDLSQKIINYSDIEDEFRWINKEGFEIQAEDVDNAIENLTKYFKLTPEEVKVIEDAVNKSYGNPAEDRKNDYEEDIYELERLLDEDNDRRLHSKKVIEAVADLIYKLKHSNYTGLEKE